MTARQPEVFLTLGFAAISWIEHYLVHGPGDVQGEPIELDDEFAAFIVKAYQVKPDGSRKIRRAVISRPKGRAKSELAAMVACFEALGPCRFDHFAEEGEMSAWGYAYDEGEPVGKPITRAEIQCFATELDQAGNTYDAIVFMLDPETCAPSLIADYGKIDAGITRINLPGGGQITPETAKDTSKDGGKSTFVVGDETHLWVLATLKRLHQTVLRNLLKRKIASGWMLETTTMYAPGEGSVAEGTHEYAKAVREGRSKDDSLLFDHREAPADCDASKSRDRLRGLKFVYGPAASWMALDAIAESYNDPQTSPAQWERYWFNRGVTLQGAWLPQRSWDAAAAPGRAIADGIDVVLSLDGSFNGDTTALVGVACGDVPHVFVVGCWEKPEDAKEWQVDVLEVEDAIRAAAIRWNVVEIVADPYRWARSLQVLADEGLPVEHFPQSAQRMTPATQRVFDLVTQSPPGLTHSGDLRLSQHVSNAVLKVDSRGTRIQKEHKSSRRKIDLAVAMVMGVERAVWHGSFSSVEPGIYFV